MTHSINCQEILFSLAKMFFLSRHAALNMLFPGCAVVFFKEADAGGGGVGRLSFVELKLIDVQELNKYVLLNESIFLLKLNKYIRFIKHNFGRLC